MSDDWGTPLDPFVSLTAGETNRQAAKSAGTPSSLLTGTATSNTAEDGTVQVLIDAPESLTSTDEDESSDEPIVARCRARWVAKDERVHIQFSGGTAYVDGSGGSDGEGQPDILGAASVAPGGDIPVASTAQTRIPGLDCDVAVLHPGHLIRTFPNLHLVSAAGSNTLIGRVIRTDADGTDVEVGRFLRSGSMANLQSVQGNGHVDDFSPEPGLYTYGVTIQALVTGFVLILTPTGSPLTMATNTVEDRGPVPVGYTAS